MSDYNDWGGRLDDAEMRATKLEEELELLTDRYNYLEKSYATTKSLVHAAYGLVVIFGVSTVISKLFGF